MIELLVALFRVVVGGIAVLCGLAVGWVAVFGLLQGQLGAGQALVFVLLALVAVILALGISAVLLRISDQLEAANFHLKKMAQAAEPPVVKPDFAQGPGDTIKVYMGRPIVKSHDGVTVGGRKFANVLEAERFIAGS